MTRVMRRVLALLLAGSLPPLSCYSSATQTDEESDIVSSEEGTLDAVSEDALGHDEGFDPGDSPLAPSCEVVPTSCLATHVTARFETSQALESGWELALLHGLAVDGDGHPAILHVLERPAGPDGLAADVPRLTMFDSDGALMGEAGSFPEVGSFSSTDARGDLVAAGDGSIVALWRVPYWDDSGPARTLLGHRTYVAAIVDGTTGPSSVFHQTGVPRDGQWFLDATAATVDAIEFVISTGPDGLLLSPISDPVSTLDLPTDRPPVRELRAVGFDSHRVAVAWSELGSEAEPGMAGMVGLWDVRGGTADAVQVFGLENPMEADVLLAKAGDTLFLARYERDVLSLRDSRIRIAHLDVDLRRVEPDRWLDGWGGLTPAGMAMTAWRDRMWIIFRTLDARYASNPVLFAQPLAEDPCGYSVNEPAAAFVPHHLDQHDLLVAADSAGIWIALNYLEDAFSGSLIRLLPCE